MTESDKERGVYFKWDLQRADGDPSGKHHNCFKFVLDLEHDPFALPALEAYAQACATEYPALAADLRTALTTRRGSSMLPIMETARDVIDMIKKLFQRNQAIEKPLRATVLENAILGPLIDNLEREYKRSRIRVDRPSFEAWLRSLPPDQEVSRRLWDDSPYRNWIRSQGTIFFDLFVPTEDFVVDEDGREVTSITIPWVRTFEHEIDWGASRVITAAESLSVLERIAEDGRLQ